MVKCHQAFHHIFLWRPNEKHGWSVRWPRLNFAALILSLLLAAGALAKMRKSLSDTRTEIKKAACNCLQRLFPFRSCVLRRFRIFEPNPRLELGTPSLRVKCSTTELIRPADRYARSVFECKYRNYFVSLRMFGRKSEIFLGFLLFSHDLADRNPNAMITFPTCLTSSSQASATSWRA